MSENNPPSNIQANPVEFSPSQSMTETADGLIVPPAPRPPLQLTAFVPLALLFLTLNFSAVRDIVTLNKRLTTINNEDAPSRELLKKAGKQTEFIDSIRDDLAKLALTDPVAARINHEFFSPPPATTPANTDASKAPAK